VESRIVQAVKALKARGALPEEVPVYNLYEWLSDCFEMNAIAALAPLVGNIELRHAVNPGADVAVGKHNFLLRPQGRIIEDYIDSAGNILLRKSFDEKKGNVQLSHLEIAWREGKSNALLRKRRFMRGCWKPGWRKKGAGILSSIKIKRGKASSARGPHSAWRVR
jgi:hypothetical protein